MSSLMIFGSIIMRIDIEVLGVCSHIDKTGRILAEDFK